MTLKTLTIQLVLFSTMTFILGLSLSVKADDRKKVAPTTQSVVKLTLFAESTIVKSPTSEFVVKIENFGNVAIAFQFEPNGADLCVESDRELRVTSARPRIALTVKPLGQIRAIDLSGKSSVESVTVPPNEHRLILFRISSKYFPATNSLIVAETSDVDAQNVATSNSIDLKH